MVERRRSHLCCRRACRNHRRSGRQAPIRSKQSESRRLSIRGIGATRSLVLECSAIHFRRAVAEGDF